MGLVAAFDGDVAGRDAGATVPGGAGVEVQGWRRPVMTQEQAKLRKSWMHMVVVGVEGWMGGVGCWEY